jgi:hypothetical protein
MSLLFYKELNMKYCRQWLVKVEQMMLKEEVMLSLMHFLLTWQGN